MEKTVIHPIGLVKLFFTRSSVVSVPGYTPDGEVLSISPENTIDLAQDEDDPGRYIVTMKTVLNQSGDIAVPYSVDMECIGMFTAEKTLSKEEAIRGVMITAHSVLYGAIREAVSWISGRHPYGTLMLGLSILPSRTPDKPDQ